MKELKEGQTKREDVKETRDDENRFKGMNDGDEGGNDMDSEAIKLKQELMEFKKIKEKDYEEKH